MEDQYRPSRSDFVAFSSLLLTIFLLPLFFIPSTQISLPLAKSALIIVLVSTGIAAALINAVRSRGIYVPRYKTLLVIILLPLVYFISSFASSNALNSLFGYNLEVGTFISILIGILLLGLIAFVANTSGKIMRLLEAFFISAGVLIIFAMVKVLSMGKWLGLVVMQGNMANPVGSWTDYAMFFSVVLVFSLLTLEFFKTRGLLKVILYAVLSLTLFLLIVINFSVAWWILLVASTLLLIYFGSIGRRFSLAEGTQRSMISPRVVALFLISLIFVINPSVSFKGSRITNYITTKFNVENINIRPSFKSTLEVDRSSILRSPIFGSGPNTFVSEWLMYKTKELNNTAFWNTPFSNGIGFIPTQVSSTGILGSVAWLAFLGFLIFLGFKALFSHYDKENRFLVLTTFSMSFILWASFFIYSPSSTMLYLAFIFSGLFIASCVQVGVVPMVLSNFRQSRLYVVSVVSTSVFVGVLAIINLYSARTTLAFMTYRQALALSSVAGVPVDTIEGKLQKAIKYSPSDIYYRSLSDLYISKARAALAINTGNVEESTKAFQDSLALGLTNAQKAVNLYPSVYANWISLGSIYEALVPEPFKVKGAYESANAAYLEALKLNPLSPEVPYLLGRLEFENGNLAKAREYVNNSLSLKNDYADAYFLLTQIELSDKNIDKAIKSAETGAELSPGNAGVLFELGLLKYSAGDYKGAGGAFLEAIKIVPNYANAKYFLGLTLSKLGDNKNALLLFEDLASTNPDNQELTGIISNLKAGHDPLYKSPAPKPEKRISAPIPSKTI